MDVQTEKGPYRFEPKPVILAFALADKDRIFWGRYWSTRKEKTFTMETAKKMLANRIDEINSGKELSEEERFHLWFAVWDSYFSERDSLLLDGKDVVLDSITSADTRLNNLRTDVGCRR